MKIKDLAPTWPPFVTTEHQTAVSLARLDDMVLDVERRAGPMDFIVVTLRTADGSTYRISLIIDEHFIKKAIQMIRRKRNITLGEVGELDV